MHTLNSFCTEGLKIKGRKRRCYRPTEKHELEESSAFCTGPSQPIAKSRKPHSIGELIRMTLGIKARKLRTFVGEFRETNCSLELLIE